MYAPTYVWLKSLNENVSAIHELVHSYTLMKHTSMIMTLSMYAGSRHLSPIMCPTVL